MLSDEPGLPVDCTHMRCPSESLLPLLDPIKELFQTALVCSLKRERLAAPASCPLHLGGLRTAAGRVFPELSSTLAGVAQTADFQSHK